MSGSSKAGDARRGESNRPLRIGRYVLAEEVGRGSMGVVYRARDPELDRDVALKVLRPSEFAPTLVERFRRESRLAARLRHENILPVFDVGEAEGVLYFTMELVDGETLADLLRKEGRLAPEVAARIALAVARGLQHAHEQGVLHRDLKPSNILLTKDRRPLLADFGLAKDLTRESDLTRTGVALGTPAYMSPEQAEASRKDFDQRSDIYSLGALLYESLTGTPPFVGRTPLETVQLLFMYDPTPVREFRKDVPRSLERIVHRALAKSKEQRFESAQEFAASLEGFLAGARSGPLAFLRRVLRRGR